MSPTQRSLAECKRRGWPAQVVERYVPFARRRIDLFGIVDIVALTPDGIMGIQSTSASNHASRRTKAYDEPRLRTWLNCGGRFAVWSFGKKRVNGRMRWVLREEELL